MAEVRAPWLGRFARQIARDVLVHVAIAVSAAVTIFLIVDFVEVGNQAPDTATSTDLAWLSLFNVPRVLELIFPIAAPIGAMTAIGAKMRRLEIPAMFAAGAGPASILKPVVLAGALCAAGYAAVVDRLVPPSAARVTAMRRRLRLPQGDDAQRQAWFKGEGRLYRIRTLASPDGSELEGVLMLDVAGGRILDRWDIARLEHRDGGWIGHDVVRRKLGETPGEVVTARFEETPIDLAEAPRDFVNRIAAPERLSYEALAEITEARERLGRPAVAHRIELYRRRASPMAVMLAIAFAAAVALRFGRRQNLAGGLGAGACIGFSLWVVDEMTSLIGRAGATSPWMAAHVLPALLVVLAAAAWAAVGRRGIADR